MSKCYSLNSPASASPSDSTQQTEILGDLLAAAIHLTAHCGDDFQTRIAEQMDLLPPDDDEEDC